MNADPAVEAVASKLMELYGQLDIWADDEQLYEDAAALVIAAKTN